MSATLVEGTVFAGRYRVVRCLASGGMGSVYEVVHLDTNRRRALKVMHPHLFQSEEMRARFKLEARIAGEVDSEYIVDVSDAGVDEATKTPFLVMELLRGEELGDRVKRMGPLPLEEVVTYMQQAAWALDRTHAASIVHRDLKPENLFLTTREDGTPRIKILDFGVAKLLAEGATAAGATRSLGTPLYMPPEQFRAGTRLTAAADIHSLTLMTYTLLVGEAYWTAEANSTSDLIAFAMIVINGPTESPVQRAARRGVALPPGFDAWFAKGTARDPLERFSTATEAVKALRAVGGPLSPEIAPTTVNSFVAADAGMTFRESRPALASAPMVERTMTSMGAPARTDAARSRAPLVAVAAILGVGVLGASAWFSLHRGRAGEDTSPLVVQAASAAAPAASSAPPVDMVPSVTVSTLAPTASARAIAAPSSAGVTAQSTRTAAEGKAPARPAGSANKPVVLDPNKFSRK